MTNSTTIAPAALLSGAIQDYPNIVETINRTWGTDQLPKYISSLLISSSVSSHEFSTYIFIELNKIHHEHDLLFPNCALKPPIWY